MATTIQTPPPFEFEVGESIVCVHFDKCPYEAKVMDISEVNGTSHYHVHYLGWNARFDEKVAVGKAEGKMHKGSLREFIDKHRTTINPKYLEDYDERMKKIEGRMTSQKKSHKFETKARMLNASEEYKKELEAAGKKVPEWIIKLPPNLIEVLIQDQQLMNDGFLYRIPAKWPIDSIIAEYQKTLTGDTAEDKANHMNSVCAIGIVDYFNTALGYQLLYKNERQQYNQLISGIETEDDGAATMKDDFRSSEKYGLVHLVRLFMKLPKLVEFNYEINDIPKHIAPRVDEFVKFLSDNCSKFYNGQMDYEKKALKKASKKAEKGPRR